MFIFQLMKSKLLLGLAAVSLLLAIAMVVFWIRSYQFYDAVYYSNLERSHQLFTVPGSIVFSTWTHLPTSDFTYDSASGLIGAKPLKVLRNGKEVTIEEWDWPPGMHAGFWWERGTIPFLDSSGAILHQQSHLNVAFPAWIPVLVFLLAPLGWCLKLWQRYRRARSGRCIYCNTEMPTPDRCPNCEREFENWIL